MSVLRRLSIIVAIAVIFLFGLVTTVYLSLRSPEVSVPEVVGKDRFEAERILGEVGLNFRVRATRPSNQSKPDTVLFQLPRAGQVVKVGQTVAMDISRAAKEGEAAEGEEIDKKVAEQQADSSSSTDTNDNKPKRNRNANKNANENANSNSNQANRNANANRGNNRNADSADEGQNANTNRRANSGNANSTRNANQEPERRLPFARPSPGARQSNNDEPPRN